MTTEVPAADTSVTAKPPRWWEVVTKILGELARPFVLYAIGTATAKAIWTDATADKIGAAGFVLIAVYGAKAAEVAIKGHNEAKVAQAQIAASPTAGDPSRAAG